ncbi:MAG: hypothetical protein ABFQ62_03175 [Patescibacteria group bacterium]
MEKTSSSATQNVRDEAKTVLCLPHLSGFASQRPDVLSTEWRELAESNNKQNE